MCHTLSGCRTQEAQNTTMVLALMEPKDWREDQEVIKECSCHTWWRDEGKEGAWAGTQSGAMRSVVREGSLPSGLRKPAFRNGECHRQKQVYLCSRESSQDEGRSRAIPSRWAHKVMGELGSQGYAVTQTNPL